MNFSRNQRIILGATLLLGFAFLALSFLPLASSHFLHLFSVFIIFLGISGIEIAFFGVSSGVVPNLQVGGDMTLQSRNPKKHGALVLAWLMIGVFLIIFGATYLLSPH